MTITASAPKTAPLRADLPAATAALAQLAARSPELKRSSRINKAGLTRSRIKHAARSRRHPCDRHVLPSKSP